MTDFDIRRIDFLQLAVLASLLRTGKATETAAELGMTQSTVSHALARLRETLGDRLFVRRSHGLEPTARARDLAPLLDAMFGLARRLVEEPEFRPDRATGLVRIGAADHHAALMGPPLMAGLAERAPDLRLSFRPLIRRAAIEALLAGGIDFAIGRLAVPAPALASVPLFEETYAAVARRDHPAFAAGLDLDAYCAARHVVVSLEGDLSGVVDDALERLGRRRTVVAAVPYFLAALSTAAATDCLVTLPARIAAAYAARFGLEVRDPPVALRGFTVRAVFPASAEASGRTAFLLDAFRTAVSVA
jgi:DNA-binding transcriptional LysR family regulator